MAVFPAIKCTRSRMVCTVSNLPYLKLVCVTHRQTLYSGDVYKQTWYNSGDVCNTHHDMKRQGVGSLHAWAQLDNFERGAQVCLK